MCPAGGYDAIFAILVHESARAGLEESWLGWAESAPGRPHVVSDRQRGAVLMGLGCASRRVHWVPGTSAWRRGQHAPGSRRGPSRNDAGGVKQGKNVWLIVRSAISRALNVGGTAVTDHSRAAETSHAMLWVWCLVVALTPQYACARSCVCGPPGASPPATRGQNAPSSALA
jgi:hypothetical protein